MSIRETHTNWKKLQEAQFPFAEYEQDEVPEGTWQGHLDEVCYPKGGAAGLHVFLTQTDTQKKYRLFQHWLGGCEPHQVWKEASVGGLFEVTIGRSRNGRPKFLKVVAL
jgi:hypothetical protein